MKGTDESFDFDLAESLGMTVAELRSTMPAVERMQWRERAAIKKTLNKLAADTARGGL